MEAVLGTLNFQRSGVDARAMLEAYASMCTTKYIDTATYYANEHVLGGLLDDDWIITTKADPWPEHDFSRASEGGGLSPGNVRAQVSASLRCLPHVHTLYLHAWDAAWDAGGASLSETMTACDDMFRTSEAFDELGISNFSAAQIARAMEACEDLSVSVSAYQGMYNVACRKVEEVFPLVRDAGMRFEAYNPLAGGLLTGGAYRGTRKQWTDYDRMFFSKPRMREIGASTTPDMALRWLSHHSKLRAGDRVVLGASTPAQLLENLQGTCPLDGDTLRALDALAGGCASDSPAYYC